MTDVLKAEDVEAAADKAKEVGAFDANTTNTTGAKTKGDVFTSFNVDDFSVPRGRDEDWRFTPLRRLNGLHDTVVDGDITLTFTGTGADTTSFGALAVVAGEHAEANVVLRFEGHGNYADFHSYSIGTGAHINVAIIDDMEDDAVHLANEQLRLDRDAVMRHGYSAFGGSVVRNISHVAFKAPGADCELSGVYFADDGQYFEQRLLVDHSEANCRSNVMYKGALQGLEIATGEIIGAGHAATVGRFDDEQLYYLMSRGIPEPVARRLIVHGFFTEVISRIPIPAVQDELEKRVSEELDTVSLDELNSLS